MKSDSDKGRNKSRNIDWIVLTATLTGLFIVLAASIRAGDRGLAAQVVSQLGMI
ncbi:MAG: hypothetical protein P1U53_16310 [Sulfitobacter sp.]|nr:hypothetical protein [Sulfitobacter sp.]